MPLALYYRPSFERGLKSLSSSQKEIVALVLEALQVYYDSSCDLEAAQRIAPRFFYKQLKRPYYEAGVERNLRVVIRRENERCIAMLAGNHDQIQKFLANN